MSNNYTINQQYHTQKDIDIYVVRLTVKVSKETFSELKELAKEHNGYYSSFRGVHGFVFTLEEDATDFGEKLDERLVNLNELSDSNDVSSSIDILKEVSIEAQLPVVVDTTQIAPKWTRKMNDDQTNDFFLSITEYDNSREEIVKSTINNLGFYINTFGQLTIAFEIHRTDKSNKWVALNFAVYDQKGRIRETGQAGLLHDGINSRPFTYAIFEIKPSKIGKIKLFLD